MPAEPAEMPKTMADLVSDFEWAVRAQQMSGTTGNPSPEQQAALRDRVTKAREAIFQRHLGTTA